MCLTPHARASTKFMLEFYFSHSDQIFFCWNRLYFFFFLILCVYVFFLCVSVRVPFNASALAPRRFVDRCYHLENFKLIFPFCFSLCVCFFSLSIIGVTNASERTSERRSGCALWVRSGLRLSVYLIFISKIVLSFDMNWNGLAIHFIDLIVCRCCCCYCCRRCRWPVRCCSTMSSSSPCLSSLFYTFLIRETVFLNFSFASLKQIAGCLLLYIQCVILLLFFFSLLFFKI